MDIEIVVSGESGKWVLNLPRIRIGNDPNCEVSLPPGKFPAVAGEHVTLEMVGGAVSLARGMSPGGETYINGYPAGAGAAIRSGDLLRLGAGGPELRIRLLEREAYATTVQHEPTRVLSQPAAAISETSRMTHEPTRIISGPESAAHSAAPPVTTTVVGRQGYTSEVVRGTSAAPRTHVQQPAASADDDEGLRVQESKMKSIQNILVINLVILLVMLGCNFWQSWELSQTRDEVQQLQAQASNATAQLMPQLNDRLNSFEQRMDGMDAKIATAQDRLVKTMDAQTKHEEDRMVERMNTAIPAMLDKYIGDKLAQVKR
jgi:hypothetical protein